MPEDCMNAGDLKKHEIATACERWHMGDPLAALAATLNTNSKQLALAFLLAGLTPDRVGIGVRTGRWGRLPMEGGADTKAKPDTKGKPKAQPAAEFPADSPFRYGLRPRRAMVPHVLFGEDIKLFSADSLTTKVDDLHRAALPLEYIRALTGADEKLVRTRASVLRRQNVKHMLLTLADLDCDPLGAAMSAPATIEVRRDGMRFTMTLATKRFAAETLPPLVDFEDEDGEPSVSDLITMARGNEPWPGNG